MTQTQELQLPPEAITLLKKIQEKHNINLKTLEREVIKKYQSNAFFQSDTTKTLQEKLLFCTKTIKGHYDNLIPYNPYDIVPTGIGPIKLINNGSDLRSEIHVWTKEKDKSILRSVSVTGINEVARLNQIQFFNYYEQVKLGRFSSGDFSMDHRSEFLDPKPLKLTPLQIFERVGITRCKIKDVLDNISKESGGYPVTTDCRIIRGIIIGHNKGVKTSDAGVKKNWAYYDIYDASLDEDFTDPEGTVVKTILRVFVHPMLMIYEKDNQMDFVGSLQVYNKGVTMQGYTILPAYTPSGKIEET